jgi:DNA polymerase-3 subunit delta
MADQIKPAYLIGGSDEAKIAATRRRLRERAEREGGPGALRLFEPGDGRRGPDAAALVAALAEMSLTASRRYLLADGVEGWGKGDCSRVAEALSSLPPDATLVLVAHGKAPAGLAKPVKAAGGEVLAYEAPRARELPKHLVAGARERGFTLDPQAARLLVERVGDSPLRLHNELDRLALWAGEGGEVTVPDLERMIADTPEEAIWSLADAVTEGDTGAALGSAERLAGQGEAVTRLIYSMAPRLRQAQRAASELEEGRPQKEVASSLSMHPYAARMLVQRVRGRSPSELARAVTVTADLELWCRGGSDYGEDVALTLALCRATGEADTAGEPG